jgi:hypothetical protein
MDLAFLCVVTLVVDVVAQMALIAPNVPALATIDAAVVRQRLAALFADLLRLVAESASFAPGEVAVFDAVLDALTLEVLALADGRAIVGDTRDGADAEQAGGKDECAGFRHTRIFHVACQTDGSRRIGARARRNALLPPNVRRTYSFVRIGLDPPSPTGTVGRVGPCART